jgi:peptidoglycan DL-endopeptidase CwlO
MSVETFGPTAVQARIAEIQGRFASAPSSATPVSSRGATGTGTGSSSAGGATAARATVGAAASGASQGTGGFAAALARLAESAAPPAPAPATPSASSSTPQSSSPVLTGDQVVADARKYLGIPYVWGGTDPAKGLDCSGLVQRVYADLGIDLPRVSQDQAHVGQAVPSLAEARPGDLLCFGTPADHIGIYIGGHQMIVAPKTGDVVKVQDVYRTPSTIRRVLPDSAPGDRTPVAGGAGVPAGVATAASSSPALAAAPAAYRSLFEEAGRRHGVAPALLAAVAKVESGFNRSAVSGAGARGLMQLMPSTARGLGVDPMDPVQAVDGAARLLASHLRTYGSVPLALAAYNAGPGAVNRYNGVPPYAETQSYVRKVQAAMTGASS